jgi:hypothetical protein
VRHTKESQKCCLLAYVSQPHPSLKASEVLILHIVIHLSHMLPSSSIAVLQNAQALLPSNDSIKSIKIEIVFNLSYVSNYLSLRLFSMVMTLTETFCHLNVERAIMGRSTATIYRPFTRTIDMPSTFAKER